MYKRSKQKHADYADITLLALIKYVKFNSAPLNLQLD